MGEIDLATEHLSPVLPGISVVGASSDHTVLDVTDAQRPVAVGDEIELRCAYTAVSTGWSSVTTDRVVLT
jgi:predicted amino acid racemase